MSARLRDDAGFTLTEMIAASAVFALVSLSLIGIFSSTLNVQQTVGAVTTTTNEAQTAADVIDAGVRNAAALELTAHGDDQLLVAKVAGAGSTLSWQCRAWYYSAAGAGELRMTQTNVGTVIGAPGADALEGWTLLVAGVSPSEGTEVFSLSDSTVTVGFLAQVTESEPISIEFASTSLVGITEDSQCY